MMNHPSLMGAFGYGGSPTMFGGLGLASSPLGGSSYGGYSYNPFAYGLGSANYGWGGGYGGSSPYGGTGGSGSFNLLREAQPYTDSGNIIFPSRFPADVRATAFGLGATPASVGLTGTGATGSAAPQLTAPDLTSLISPLDVGRFSGYLQRPDTAWRPPWLPPVGGGQDAPAYGYGLGTPRSRGWTPPATVGWGW